MDMYIRILKIVVFIWGLVLWGVSVFFSKNGFGIQTGGMEWIGFILAIAVTLAELMFNRTGSSGSISIFVLGIGAYIYGIYTNTVGLMDAQGMPIEFSMKVIWPLFLASILEWSPELFLLWAMGSGDDPLSRAFGGVSSSLFSKGGGQHSVPTSPFRGSPPFRGTPPSSPLSYLHKPPSGEGRDKD